MTLKKQGLASKHYRLHNSKWAEWRSASGLRQKKNKKKKNKARVEHEPRSAHGRAVNKPRVNLEPRSAHGRAVNKTLRIHQRHTCVNVYVRVRFSENYKKVSSSKVSLNSKDEMLTYRNVCFELNERHNNNF